MPGKYSHAFSPSRIREKVSGFPVLMVSHLLTRLPDAKPARQTWSYIDLAMVIGVGVALVGGAVRTDARCNARAQVLHENVYLPVGVAADQVAGSAFKCDVHGAAVIDHQGGV